MSGRGAYRARRVRESFEAIVELEGTQRAAALDSLAASDPEVAAELAQLLEVDARAAGLLDEPLDAIAGELIQGWLDPADAETTPTTVGHFRILGPLGSGGMGEVFLAERVDGRFEQRMALKLLRAGMASEELVQRFARERQILARLEHPGIARLIDGGVAEDGRPYLAMELVDGSPITEHCETAGLGVADRIRLMAEAADAVDAAHRRLVVHRDLKPSNVLVDREGRVKLLDFGIAKLLAGDDLDGSLTRTELQVLTPLWAAPEQVLGEPVTTATDVWGLGALLYRLLTGRQPVARDGSSLAALAASVAGETVERPSTAVRRSGAGSASDGGRQAAARLRGDLDTILLKALAREPERRYLSAADFAADLRRHLAGRPVVARPDTFSYRTGKLLRRHRLAAVLTLVAVLALVAGLLATAWQARRAKAASQRANAARDFLVRLFEQADPEHSGGGTVTARRLVEDGTARIERELVDEPELRAELEESLARINRSLGDLEAAAGLADRALEGRSRLLGSSHPAVAEAMVTRAAIAADRGQTAAAEHELRQAIAVLDGAGASKQMPAARGRLELAGLLAGVGREPEALGLAETVVATLRTDAGADPIDLGRALRLVGRLLAVDDRLGEAASALGEAAAILESRVGPAHPLTTAARLDLALLAQQRGDFAAAEQVLAEVLAATRAAWGDHHVRVAEVLRRIGELEHEAGRSEVARQHLRSALEIYRQVNPASVESGTTLMWLAYTEDQLGDTGRALELGEQALTIVLTAVGESSWVYRDVANGVAGFYATAGRFDEAVAILRASLDWALAAPQPDRSFLMGAWESFGITLGRAGRHAEAADAQRQALELRRSVQGPDHVETARVEYRLAKALVDQGEPAALASARPLLEHALKVFDASGLGAADWRVAMGSIYLALVEAREGESEVARRRLEATAAALAAAGDPLADRLLARADSELAALEDHGP